MTNPNRRAWITFLAVLAAIVALATAARFRDTDDGKCYQPYDLTREC